MERLSYRDAERKEALRATIAESYYSQFDFRPQLTKKAQSMKARPGLYGYILT